MDLSESAFERAPVALLVLDRRGAIRAVNAAAERTLGRPVHKLVGTPLAQSVHDEGRAALTAALAGEAAGSSFTLRTPGGERWMRWLAGPAVSGAPLLFAVFDVTDLVEIARQLEEAVDELVVSNQIALETQSEDLERLRAEAEYRASHDELTKVLSRRAWFESGARVPPTAVAVIDIDHFKRVNDRHGHVGGDIALREVAWRIEALIGDCGEVGRLGGEEFGVLLHGDPAAAEHLLARVIGAVAENPIEVLPGVDCALTVSAGLARATGAEPGERAADTLQTLYARADASLYRAKNSGRARVVVDARTAA